MKVAVALTAGAELDLTDIYEFVGRQDGIQGVLEKLRDFPDRGEYPPELLALGIKQFSPSPPQALPHDLSEHTRSGRLMG